MSPPPSAPITKVASVALCARVTDKAGRASRAGQSCTLATPHGSDTGNQVPMSDIRNLATPTLHSRVYAIVGHHSQSPHSEAEGSLIGDRDVIAGQARPSSGFHQPNVHFTTPCSPGRARSDHRQRRSRSPRSGVEHSRTTHPSALVRHLVRLRGAESDHEHADTKAHQTASPRRDDGARPAVPPHMTAPPHTAPFRTRHLSAHGSAPHTTALRMRQNSRMRERSTSGRTNAPAGVPPPPNPARRDNIGPLDSSPLPTTRQIRTSLQLSNATPAAIPAPAPPLGGRAARYSAPRGMEPRGHRAMSAGPVPTVDGGWEAPPSTAQCPKRI